MPRDTATEPSTPARRATSAHPNDVVIGAVRAHHAQLAQQLDARTSALLTSARSGNGAKQRDELHEWYRTVLLPHIVAEEKTLYSVAADMEATRLLIRGMLAEHRELVSLIADLAFAARALDAATIAASAQALLRVHLSMENDLLLPALDAAGVDLAAVVDGLHDILGDLHSAADASDSADGCGCGCGHGAEDAQPTPTPVQITAAPPVETRAATDTSGDLDVRALPHGHRHDIIFARLDVLAPGESLVIVNDHDPKPLRYQTSAMWPDRFVWTYRESGPRVWRVAISRVD